MPIESHGKSDMMDGGYCLTEKNAMDFTVSCLKIASFKKVSGLNMNSNGLLCIYTQFDNVALQTKMSVAYVLLCQCMSVTSEVYFAFSCYCSLWLFIVLWVYLFGLLQRRMFFAS